ncbi:hypothetical protein J4427_03545 [Candidatus Woesearchaeota archaeon]|nr:hypothetical protein [Candidatus Woesearchaeota archaeon]
MYNLGVNQTSLRFDRNWTLEDLSILEDYGWERHYGDRFDITGDNYMYEKISGYAEAHLYVGRYADKCIFELSFLWKNNLERQYIGVKEESQLVFEIVHFYNRKVGEFFRDMKKVNVKREKP